MFGYLYDVNIAIRISFYHQYKLILTVARYYTFCSRKPWSQASEAERAVKSLSLLDGKPHKEKGGSTTSDRKLNWIPQGLATKPGVVTRQNRAHSQKWASFTTGAKLSIYLFLYRYSYFTVVLISICGHREINELHNKVTSKSPINIREIQI